MADCEARLKRIADLAASATAKGQYQGVHIKSELGTLRRALHDIHEIAKDHDDQVLFLSRTEPRHE